MDTPANRKAIPNADISKWVQPATVAELVVWLASDAGKDVTDPRSQSTEKMLEIIANSIVYSLVLYAGLGLVFAVPFVWLVQRIDSEAQGSGVGFRLLILPGVAALWPMFIYRLMREIVEPPIEKNPHRLLSKPLSGKS